MPLSALEIKKKEFDQKMRGYDVEEVRRFLDTISQEVDTLTRDNISFEEELTETKKRLAHYLSLESMLEKTLLAAQNTAIKMEEQAKKGAELILQEARLEKEKALKDIPVEIERARAEVTRLKGEYEATLVRVKSVMEGFGKFLETVAEK